jgi:hypothetical protein
MPLYRSRRIRNSLDSPPGSAKVSGKCPAKGGGLWRGYYRPSKERSGGWVRPVYSKVYTITPIRGKGRKRVSQEAWRKGLGHWDTPSIGRKRAIGGSVCLQGSSRAQEPLSRPLSREGGGLSD